LFCMTVRGHAEAIFYSSAKLSAYIPKECQVMVIKQEDTLSIHTNFRRMSCINAGFRIQ